MSRSIGATIEKIEEMIRKHELWLWLEEKEGGERADFSNFDFSPIYDDLRFPPLPHIDFKGCNLSKAIFNDVKLPKIRFIDAVLKEVNFNGADLSSAYFENVSFERSSFRGANLTSSTFKECNCSFADFGDANLTRANCSGSNFCMANLRCTNLYRTIFRNGNLNSVDLNDAETFLTDFREADLTNANLDFSSLPLWCGSFDMKVDAKIMRQIAYHFCRLKCDDRESIDMQNALLDFANKFHRTEMGTPLRLDHLCKIPYKEGD
jgi:uncharacterized protein YjbI with pentapeptide repeats